MTCRGSRRNTVDKAKNIYEDSPEWLAQNRRSTRNFIRKWGHFVKHDPLMKPIIPPKYDIGIHIKNTTGQLLEVLEPWCTSMYTDINFQSYVHQEQPNTDYNILNKMYGIEDDITNDITIYVDGNTFTNEDMYYIQEISSIISDNGEIGEFELGNLRIEIIAMVSYEHELINCEQ